MRPVFLSLAAVGLLAGTAAAQVPHVLVPGSDQIVTPAPNYNDSSPQSPPSRTPASPGLQSGEAGIAAGSNDFPRVRPDPGSQAGVTSTAGHVARSVNAYGRPVSARVRDYPSSWAGSAQDWTMHVQACRARYSSYDATDDTYRVRPGVRATCPAGFR